MLLTSLSVLFFSCVTAENARKSDTRTDLGTAYLKEGNAPGAVEALRTATSLNPQNATAWERLALAYMASDADDLAEDAFKKGIKLGTSEEPARIIYNYGLLLLSLERYEEALTAFDSTLADLTYRTPAKALNSKGFTLYTMGRHDEAIKVLSDAIRRVPKFCQARFHRGLAYQATAQHRDALDDFETVMQTCGDEAIGSYYHAAEALFVLGEPDAGCTYLRTALREAKSDAFSKQIRGLASQECAR
jgi:tetratricopeptide (TPR) repeat protein